MKIIFFLKNRVKKGQDEELDSLCDTVQSGLRICQRAIQRDEGECNFN